jgi:hypothetical protein
MIKTLLRGAAMALALFQALPAQAADKVTLMLNWYVYGEHAPFYYGKERGIFAAEGIDLDIQEGRGSGVVTQAVAAGSVPFGYVDVTTAMRAAMMTTRPPSPRRMPRRSTPTPSSSRPGAARKACRTRRSRSRPSMRPCWKTRRR